MKNIFYHIYIAAWNDEYGFIIGDPNGVVLLSGRFARKDESHIAMLAKVTAHGLNNIPQNSHVEVISFNLHLQSEKNRKLLLQALIAELGGNSRLKDWVIDFSGNDYKYKNLKQAIRAAKGLTVNKIIKRKPDYIAYTDGSCNNLSPFREGGAAFVIIDWNDREKIITSQSKCILGTTNNRAELLAILGSIRAVPDKSTLIIRTDSRYCINVLTDEFNAANTTRVNADIITQIFREKKRLLDVTFQWVKGHNGDYYNEMADSLAESRREEVRELYRIPVYTYKNRNEPNPRIERFRNWFETSEDAIKYKDTLLF